MGAVAVALPRELNRQKMKQQMLLRQFDYSIQASALIVAGWKQDEINGEHLSLMSVTIDFENGKGDLEGD
jgi:hypothetical protein